MALLHTVTYPGLYRVSVYATMTAVTTPGTLTVNLLWTDTYWTQGAFSDNPVITLAYTSAGDYARGIRIIYANSANINFASTFTGAGTYDLFLDTRAA